MLAVKMPTPDEMKTDAHSRLRNVHSASNAHFGGFIFDQTSSMIDPSVIQRQTAQKRKPNYGRASF